MMAPTSILRSTALLCFAVLPLLATTGCYTVNDRSVQVASEAYVEFVGARSGATFSLERDGTSVVSGLWVTEDRYAFPPGAYTLSVNRENVTVLRRRVLLTDGETMSIKIP